MEYSIIFPEKCVSCGSLLKTYPNKASDLERKLQNVTDAQLNIIEYRNLVESELQRVASCQTKIDYHVNSKIHSYEILLARREQLRKDISVTKELIIDRSNYLFKVKEKNKMLTDENEMMNICRTYVDDNTRKESKILEKKRWQEVLDAFHMIPIVPAFPERSEQQQQAVLEIVGCSTIVGIPLPNSGDYSGTPPEIVSAGLGHVAHLLETIATVLNVPLPHPVKPFGAFDYAVICPQGRLDSYLPLCPFILGNAVHNRQPPWVLSRRCPSQADLEAEGWVLNTVFLEALALLRADVVCLCLKVGVPLPSLWPAECLLLNLYSIQGRASLSCAQGHRQPPGQVGPDLETLEATLRDQLVGRYNRATAYEHSACAAAPDSTETAELRSFGHREEDWDLCTEDDLPSAPSVASSGEGQSQRV